MPKVSQDFINRRRDSIIKAALNVFYKKGYETTNMSDIAKEAGLARRTLYLHFTSKKEIYFKIHLQGLRKRIESQPLEIEKAKSGYEKLYLFGRHYYNFYKEHPAYLKMQAYWDYNSEKESMLEYSEYEKFKEENKKLSLTVFRYFEEGVNDGSLRNDLNLEYVFQLYAITLRSVIKQTIFKKKGMILFGEDYYNYYLNLFLNSIKA